MSVESGPSGAVGIGCVSSTGGVNNASFGAEVSIGNVSGIGHSLDSAIGPTISLPSSSPDTGGSFKPGLNNNLFFQTEVFSQIKSDVLGQTVEYRTPSLESFDKVVTETMLDKTSILWQAPHKDNNSFEKKIVKQPSISNQSLKLENNVFRDTIELKSPSIEVFEKVVPEEILADTSALWKATVEKPADNPPKEQSKTSEGAIKLDSTPPELFDKDVPEDLLKENIELWQVPKEVEAEINHTDALIKDPILNAEKTSETNQKIAFEKNISKNQAIEDPTRTITEALVSPYSGTKKTEDLSSEVKNENTSSILDEYLTQELSILQPQTETLKINKDVSFAMQELNADALQAAKVENAYISLGTNPHKAREIAIATLAQTQDKKGIAELLQKNIQQVPPPEKPKFIHDTEADNNRKKYAMNAVKIAYEKIENGKEEKITGKSIAETMPSGQPEDVKSKILKSNDSDGSYEHLIVDLKKIGELSSDKAGQEVEEVINSNHAVKMGDKHQASEKEIRKVLNGKSSLVKPY